MMHTDGHKIYGQQVLDQASSFIKELDDIDPSASYAAKFSYNHFNLNKAWFLTNYLLDKFDATKEYIITLSSPIVPCAYVQLLNNVFTNSKITVITNQYTFNKYDIIFSKYLSYNLVNIDPMFEELSEQYFAESDFVLMPDTDYMMPFYLIDHFKFKNCLALNYKDIHERKTNNNTAFGSYELADLCDFTNVIDHGTYNVPAPKNNDRAWNSKLFYAFGDRD